MSIFCRRKRDTFIKFDPAYFERVSNGRYFEPGHIAPTLWSEPVPAPRGDDTILVTLTRTQAETAVRMLLAHSDNSKLIGSTLTADIARQLAGFIDYETGVQ